MNLDFELLPLHGSAQSICVAIDQFVVAGWAGRDPKAIEHHIEELARLGVPRPSAVPLFYRVAANQLVQDERLQAVGGASSGEVEVLAFTHQGELLISLTSDHTDRKLESHSVALSKQLCVKPVGTKAWRYADVSAHWDELIIQSHIVEASRSVLYQQGPLASLRPPLELIAAYFGGEGILRTGCAMSCGTVGAIGGIRPSISFAMELIDPVLGRTLRHVYTVETLAEVA